MMYISKLLVAEASVTEMREPMKAEGLSEEEAQFSRKSTLTVFKCFFWKQGMRIFVKHELLSPLVFDNSDLRCTYVQ